MEGSLHDIKQKLLAFKTLTSVVEPQSSRKYTVRVDTTPRAASYWL